VIGKLFGQAKMTKDATNHRKIQNNKNRKNLLRQNTQDPNEKL
jgi:hypothetical protein